MADFEFPADLHYTTEHEWVRLVGDRARVGVTAYAQDALGDVVYVSLPEDGATVTAGSPCGEVESTKSVSDVFAPVDGVVVARNEALDDHPELVNSDPYGQGWMLEIAVEGPHVLEGLLPADDYRAQLS